MTRRSPPPAVTPVAKPPPERGVRKALADALERCAAQGAQLTEQRALVLEMLLRRHGVAKAYELLADLQNLQAGVAPMTVYRALDFLVEQGLVHKVAATSSFVVCNHEPHPDSEPVFLVCERCGDTTEWGDSALGLHVEQALAKSGFHAHGMEIKGECARCAPQPEAKGAAR